jgi:hypothetical protein
MVKALLRQYCGGVAATQYLDQVTVLSDIFRQISCRIGNGLRQNDT